MKGLLIRAGAASLALILIVLIVVWWAGEFLINHGEEKRERFTVEVPLELASKKIEYYYMGGYLHYTFRLPKEKVQHKQANLELFWGEWPQDWEHIVEFANPLLQQFPDAGRPFDLVDESKRILYGWEDLPKQDLLIAVYLYHTEDKPGRFSFEVLDAALQKPLKAVMLFPSY
jgi:hypothetical protein